jgi:hypothetical protein
MLTLFQIAKCELRIKIVIKIEEINCQNFGSSVSKTQYFLVQLALECRSTEFMRKNKKFTLPLIMTFLEVIEVPEYDKEIKKMVSVGLFMCVCLSSRLLLFSIMLQSSQWCQKIFNFIAMN